MHDDLGGRMLLFELQQLLQRKFLVHMTCAVPQHDILASRQLFDIPSQIAVGREDDRSVGRDRLHDLQRIGRSAADIGQGLDADRGIDVRNDRMAGIFRLEGRKILLIARLGQRTSRFGAGNQHLLVGAEHLGGLGHEVHAGEQDDVGVYRLRLDREGQRVAQKVGRLLHFGRGVVMGQYDGALAALEFVDPAADLRGVIDLHFLFLLFINFK